MAARPAFADSMLGTCPQLGVGPVAVTSMLIASGLAGAVPGFSQISDHNNVPPELQDAQNSYNVLAIQLVGAQQQWPLAERFP